MALIGGFGLGVAGFVYQTVFRNPLASPDIIGVSSGASVGAAFAILFVSSGALSTTVCAFAGGLAAVFLSLGLAAAAPGRSIRQTPSRWTVRTTSRKSSSRQGGQPKSSPPRNSKARRSKS